MIKGKKIIVANWKMSPVSGKEALALYKRIANIAGKLKKIKTLVAPSYIHVAALTAKKSKAVSLGVQNIFSEQKGSYTGEVSVDMASSVGAQFAIIGHSERRKLGETNDMVNKKVLLALKNKLTPIICIGEDTRDEEGKYLGLIKEQLETSLKGVSRNALGDTIIAYEPVWAIGATKAMEAREVHEMTIYITKTVMDIYKTKTRLEVPVLYGGAVDPTNAHGILTEGEAGGLLIGRVSLDPEGFGEILRIANAL
jgi:triosephosphate isomerase